MFIQGNDYLENVDKVLPKIMRSAKISPFLLISTYPRLKLLIETQPSTCHLKLEITTYTVDYIKEYWNFLRNVLSIIR